MAINLHPMKYFSDLSISCWSRQSALSPVPGKASSFERRWIDYVIAHRVVRDPVGYHCHTRRLKRGTGQASDLSPVPRKASGLKRRWIDYVIAHRVVRDPVGYHSQCHRLNAAQGRRALYRLPFCKSSHRLLNVVTSFTKSTSQTRQERVPGF
jgi:hypothetical protein